MRWMPQSIGKKSQTYRNFQKENKLEDARGYLQNTIRKSARNKSESVHEVLRKVETN